MPPGMNAPKRLPGRAGEVHDDRCRTAGRSRRGASVTSWPSIVPTARSVLRIGQVDRDLAAVRRARRCARSMSCTSKCSSSSWSCGARVAPRLVLGERRADRGSGARSSPLAFQCSTARSTSSSSLWPMTSSSERKPSSARYSRTSCGDELEEVHDELGLAREPLAQLGVLRGDADRARVEVADAHHDAALTRRAAPSRSRTPRRRAARR